MPNLEFALSCDYLFEDADRKTCIIGVFERIWADSFPARHPFFFVASRWTGDPGETFKQRARIVAPDDSEVVLTTEVRATIPPGGGTRVYNKFVEITFPQPGAYRIELLADDDVVGSISLDLSLRDQPADRAS